MTKILTVGEFKRILSELEKQNKIDNDTKILYSGCGREPHSSLDTDDVSVTNNTESETEHPINGDFIVIGY